MSPILVVSIMAVYFGALILISILTSKGADTNTFFTANRQSPWFLVAFGMIGASLSGVTFISVPGNVGKIGFGYFQIVLGYLVGYWVIIGVLMPVYYKMNVVSIYTYLEKRFSFWSYKTGAFFFLVSRTIGSSLRLFLAATVLQLFLFDAWDVPFFVTVATTIALIWIYTSKGGIKTIVWTDTFQTVFLVAAVCITVWQITDKLGMSFSEMLSTIKASEYSRIFYFDDVNSTLFFPKQFFGGAFIAITMTGMDQEIMQKNLTCKNIGEAQKNMFWFSLILVVVNLLFLVLGALLYLYSTKNGIAIPAATDELFPRLAFQELGLGVGVFFLLGITASSYASADSALAGLTTSFCIDFLDFKNKNESVKSRQKFIVHVTFSVLFLLIIILFKAINERSVIDAVLQVAGYTYGPLLGLFSFGLFTKLQVRDRLVPVVCVLSLLISLVINPPVPQGSIEKYIQTMTASTVDTNWLWLGVKSLILLLLILTSLLSKSLKAKTKFALKVMVVFLGVLFFLPGSFYAYLLSGLREYMMFRQNVLSGYQIGIELIIINGLITFIGLWLISKRKSEAL